MLPFKSVSYSILSVKILIGRASFTQKTRTISSTFIPRHCCHTTQHTTRTTYRKKVHCAKNMFFFSSSYHIIIITTITYSRESFTFLSRTYPPHTCGEITNNRRTWCGGFVIIIIPICFLPSSSPPPHNPNYLKPNSVGHLLFSSVVQKRNVPYIFIAYNCLIIYYYKVNTNGVYLKHLIK